MSLWEAIYGRKTKGKLGIWQKLEQLLSEYPEFQVSMQSYLLDNRHLFEEGDLTTLGNDLVNRADLFTSAETGDLFSKLCYFGVNKDFLKHEQAFRNVAEALNKQFGFSGKKSLTKQVDNVKSFLE